MENALVLTPSALLAFLSQIEELSNAGDISVTEGENQLEVHIGPNAYVLESDESNTIEVDSEVVDEIDAINEEGYDEVDAEALGDETEGIEGGIIKELIKTLAIGGLVRLTKNALTN